MAKIVRKEESSSRDISKGRAESQYSGGLGGGYQTSEGEGLGLLPMQGQEMRP